MIATSPGNPPYYELRSYMKNQEEWFNEPQLADFYLQEMLTSMSHGMGPTGLLLRKRRAMLDWVGMKDLANRMITEPGDYRVIDVSTDEQIIRSSWAIPIAYDVWYLFAVTNIYRFGGKAIEKTIEKMVAFFNSIAPMSSMQMEDGKDDVLTTDTVNIAIQDVTGSVLPAPPDGEIPSGSIVNVGEYSPTKGQGIYGGYLGPASGEPYDSLNIVKGMTSHVAQITGSMVDAAKQMRFEVYTPVKGSPSYDSTGPKDRQNDYAGYLSFPVGPLGVNYTVSIMTETIAIGENIDSSYVTPVEFTASDILTGEKIIPPWEIGHEATPGVNIIAKGYVISHPFMADPQEERFVEFLANDAGEPIPFHKNLRFWLPKDSKWVWPGEFTALICRPMPTHCWWFQKTSPYIYAGNWMETEFYTSGIVKEVLEPNEGEVKKDFEPEEGEVGKRYRVWVKNEELIVKSTDFYEYEVDERVGVLKTYREESGGLSSSMGPAGASSGAPANATWFSWEQLANQGTCEDVCEVTQLNKNWVIIPIAFYSTEGGLGGL